MAMTKAEKAEWDRLKRIPLKKCPFCGSDAEPVLELPGSKWRVRCTQCECQTTWDYDKAKVEFFWNRRVFDFQKKPVAHGKGWIS